MRELPPKPYPDDRELEAHFNAGMQIPRGEKPSPETERLRRMIFALRHDVLALNQEVRTLRQDCQIMQRRLDKSEAVPNTNGSIADLENIARRSLARAEHWRREQGLNDNPDEIDGFKAMHEALGRHRRKDDDAVELLRAYREDE